MVNLMAEMTLFGVFLPAAYEKALFHMQNSLWSLYLQSSVYNWLN